MLATVSAVKRRQYRYNEQGWRMTSANTWGPRGPVVYASVDGFLVFDPYRNHYPQWLDNDKPRPGIADAFRFSVDKVWDGLLLGDKPLCNGLIRDWVSWMLSAPVEGGEHSARADEVVPFRILERTLKHLSAPDEVLMPGPAIPLFVDDARNIPTVRNPWGGAPIPVVLTSAAVRRVLMFAYLLTWVWYSHTASIQASPSRAQEAAVLADRRD